VKENVPGSYYVDSSCIDCDVCRDTAPDNFRRSDANSYSFDYKQPLTEEERGASEEALLLCPVEAIGNDGE
jgi:ferredoxin